MTLRGLSSALTALVVLAAAPALAQPPTAGFEPAPPPEQPPPVEPAPPAEPPPAPPPAQPPPAPPAPPPVPPPAQPPPGYAAPATGAQQPAPYGPAPAWGAPAAEQPPEERHGLVGIVRFGFIAGGSGELDQECEGPSVICGALGQDSFDYDEESGVVIGADLLGHVTPWLRLGGGLLYSPSTSIDVEGFSENLDMGTDLSLLLVAEGLLDVGPKTAIALRGQGGLFMLFPDDDLDDIIASLEADCETVQGAGGTCDVKDGPFVGWTVGAGAGVVYDLDQVALRADFVLQFIGLSTTGQEASFAGDDIETTVSLGGTRFILAGGLEF